MQSPYQTKDLKVGDYIKNLHKVVVLEIGLICKEETIFRAVEKHDTRMELICVLGDNCKEINEIGCWIDLLKQTADIEALSAEEVSLLKLKA